MIKNILLIGFLFTSILNFAQPILTAANTNMVIGDIFNVTQYNWVAPGNSGANQTWNFSAITTSTAPSAAYTVSTIPSSVAAQFPNGNTAMNYTYGGNIYNTNSTSYQYYGFYVASSTADNLIYQNPQDVLRYPFTYSNSYIDTYSGIQQTSTGSPIYSKGTVTVTADGYGTLILPGGTFSNVLRTYNHVIAKDSTGPFNQTNITGNYYYWFLPNNHYPIFQNSVSNYGSINYQGLTVLNIITTGISEPISIIKSFNLYPNPNSGKVLNLDLNLTENAKYEIAIVDNIGREVLRITSEDVFEGYNFKTIDVSCLESGIYNLGIILEGGKTLNRKITIQK